MTSSDGPKQEYTTDDFEFLPQQDIMTKPDLIRPQAGPGEVRDYLTRLLRIRGLDQDHSKRIAERWIIGTGRELRSYPITMYRSIFGPEVEDFWAVWMAARPPLYAEDNKQNWSNGTLVSILVSLLAVMGAAFSIIRSAAREDSPGKGLGGAMLFAFGLLGVMFCLAMIFSNDDPELKAEEELKNHWHAPSGMPIDGRPPNAKEGS